MFEKQLKSPLRSPLMRAILAGSGVSTPSYYLNLSAPSNVTIADGQGRGTITSTYNAVITASMSPSRITGVAPLYVNFDMTSTTSSASTNPTHECFFATDFGDTGAGTWANGVQSAGLTSKNAGYGPVTGHVYETPGTYYPSMTVLDGDGNLVTKTGTVVVDDPDVVYAGTATICISHSNNFTGAPSGSSQINTSGNTDMYAAWNTHKASNKRILFCKADNWTCSAPMEFTNITDTTVGGYGTGVARAFGAGTLVNVDATAVSGSVFATYAGCSNLRICDMKVLGSSKTLGLSLNNGIAQMLAYKLEFRGVTGGFNAFPGIGGTNNVFDQHCIYECLVDDLYGYAYIDTPRANVTTTNGVADIAATAHPYVVGMMVHFPTSGEGTAQFPSTGTFPTPFAVTTTYFISSAGFAANTFRLAPTLADAIAGTNTTTPTASGTYPLFSNVLSGGIGAFVGLVRGGMMGCYLDNCHHGEQTLRLPFLDRAHINNNYLARPNQTKNVVKIHGFVYNEVALYSEKFVLSANEIDMREGYSNGVAIPGLGEVLATQVGDPSILCGNGGSLGDERVRNGIVENNITRACEGYPKSSLRFIGIGCPNMTVRNNIADLAIGDRTSAYTSSYLYTFLTFARISTSTNDPTVNVQVYNNSMYSNMANAESHTFVDFDGIGLGVTSTWAAGTPGVFTATNHRLYVGFRVRVSGTVPAELTVGTYYWVAAANHTANTFTLSATDGGAALTLSGSGSCAVNQFVDVDNVQVKNNLWYNPHFNLVNSNWGVKRNIGTPVAAPTNVTTSNNTDTSNSITTNPNFVATPPVALADWRPNTGSYAIDTGTTVPVLRDFNMATRSGLYALGAVLP